MIKKLDILILRSFVGPFMAALLISLFVLTMQFFWLYIDDFVGKGLDLFIVLKVIGLVALGWVPMALPLALLFSSIMTFGNLGETFELVAIRASGIPLLRFMRPLTITAVLICGVAFFFANNIVPIVNLKLSVLKYDIIVAKPAFDIKEGVFYDKIEGFVIKLGKKEKNDSVIRDVVIFEKNRDNLLQDNLLVAESGIMRITKDNRFLEFVLKNGWRYEEKGAYNTPNTQFTRMGFREYKKLFDLKSFKLNESGDSAFYDPKMLSLRQLNKAIDSLTNVDSFYLARSEREVTPYLPFARFADTGWAKIDSPALNTTARSFTEIIPDSLRMRVMEAGVTQLTSIKGNLAVLASDYGERYKQLLRHEIEWHKKFTLSVACFVMFLIGAPLGSIIRKGGLGAPLVFAIIFFVLFHLFSTFGEKFVTSEQASPLAGMWLATFLLVPVGVFLTYKAMRDSTLFNKEFYYRLFRQLRSILANFKPSRKTI